MSKIPEQKDGLARIFRAAKFSWQGFLHAIKKEKAFQQELVVSLMVLPLTFFMSISIELKLMIWMCHFAVMIVELLNSSIESVADLTEEYHQLIKQAKDMGSLAVLMAIIVLVITWGIALYQQF